MISDSERLVVLLEARIRDFEKNFQKASGTADRNYYRMRRSSKSATRQMEQDMVRSTSQINKALAASSAKIGAFGKAAIGGFLGGIVAGGVAGVVAQIGQVANSIAQVGDEAKRAGVSVEAFQEWKFVAEQNRIGIDQMTDGLKELNLRADEFVQTGKGSGAEAFMRLGYSAEELKKKLDDPSALLLEIIGRLGAFDRAAQIRISDELFGGSAGERFVELLDQGEAGIRATIQRAHELGVVMDEQMIAKAAEIDRRFNEISTTVGTNLKSAIVSATDSLIDFVNSFRDFENQRSSALDSKLADLGRERLEIEAEILRIRDEQRNNQSVTAQAENRVLEGTIAAKKEQLADLSRQEAEILAILGQRTLTKPTDRTWTPPDPPPGGFGGSTRDKEAEAATRQADAVRKLISDLEHELEIIGQSNTEKEIANTLRRAGVHAASEEGKQIAGLVRQIEAETEAQEQVRQAVEARSQALDNLYQAGADGLLSVVDGSVKAEDAVKKLIIQLALAAAQAAILGSGPLSGLFGGGGFGSLFGGILGGLFGGGGGALGGFSIGSFYAKGGAFDPSGEITAFAKGGVVDRATVFPFAKGIGLMGEAGPEAIMPLRRGRDGRLGVSAHAPAANSNGGQSVVVNQTFQISGAVSSDEIKAAIREQAARTKADIEGNFARTFEKNRKAGTL
ncbi:MAG: tail tape measure protein [Stappia sp.]|uniref:phage tail tape measure protein n=1 Tax=Stappia sp. TaxID=1870903 RepID=UPI000C69EA49|nr:tail tape measure protein [Stappia sp.]MAA98668.1 tail tape measure protein [Stappia sp.]MBM20502.1 tail tape measure protein [Stappia sp.]|tara:strand:- start:28 stop:2064 length:2037 start_codon:yes stop_codon:yes gene_type:complete